MTQEDLDNLQLLTEILSSIGDFDLAIVASLIAFYLLMFTLGFVAGLVIKLMRRA